MSNIDRTTPEVGDTIEKREPEAQHVDLATTLTGKVLDNDARAGAEVNKLGDIIEA